MRTLIVGCGYVGLALGAELVRRQHQTYGLRRSDSADAGMKAAGIIPLHGDLTDPASLEKLPGTWDYVVNTASSSRGGVAEYHAVYLEGNRNLVQWLERSPPRKFVYTSSTGVYGQNDGSIVDETAPTEPGAETSQVLLQAEQALIDAARNCGFPAVILRVAGIYGPGRGYFFNQFIHGQATLEGNGDRILNMIHRDDVAGCVIAALERGRPAEIYNAVDHEPVSQLTFYQWLAAQTGKPLPPVAPAPASTERKRGATNKRVSNRKLLRELEYHFNYPTFREGYAAELRALT